MQQIATEARWSRYVLWAVLLAAVAAMAWMAWRLSLQLRREQPSRALTNPMISARSPGRGVSWLRRRKRIVRRRKRVLAAAQGSIGYAVQGNQVLAVSSHEPT